MFKGKVIVTNQLGGYEVGEHITEGSYKTWEEALLQAEELGSDVEKYYGTYINMDYYVINGGIKNV